MARSVPSSGPLQLAHAELTSGRGAPAMWATSCAAVTLDFGAVETLATSSHDHDCGLRPAARASRVWLDEHDRGRRGP